MEEINLITYGEALTAFALLLSFTQYMTPIIKFRLHVRFKKGIKSFVIWLSIALFMVFVSKLWQFFSISVWWLKHLPTILEILTCFIMPIVILIMALITYRPHKLAKRNSERYLKETDKIISKGVETELRELGQELECSIQAIVTYAGELDVGLFEAEKRWVERENTFLYKVNNCKKIGSILSRPTFQKREEELFSSVTELGTHVGEFNFGLYDELKNRRYVEKCINRKRRLFEKKHKLSLQSRNCIKIFSVLSDPAFCKQLVLHNSSTVIFCIDAIKKKGFHASERQQDFWARPFLQELVKQAFINEESILYREAEFSGFGIEQKFTKLVFEDIEFVESSFNPMGAISLDSAGNSSRKIKKLCDITQIACKAYFSSSLFFFHNSLKTLNLGHAFSESNEVLQTLIFSDEKIEQKNAASLIHELDSFFTEIFKVIVKGTDDYVKKFEGTSLNERNNDYINSVKDGIIIHDVLVESMFKFLENLSWVRGNHHKLDKLLFMIFHMYSQNSPTAEQILNKLEEKIFERLDYNFKSNGYPPIACPLLCIFGLSLFEKDDNSWYGKFRKRFFEYLKLNFEPAFEKFGDEALKFLPSYIAYDKEIGIIHNKERPELYFSLRHSYAPN